MPSRRIGALVILLAIGAWVYLLVWGTGDGLDLQVYRAALEWWRHGRNPYNHRYTAHHLWFTYPPGALLVLWPLTWFGFRVDQVLLWTLSLACLAGSIYVTARACAWSGRRALLIRSIGWACAAVVLLEPVRSTMNYGQINTLLMVGVVVDCLVMPRRYRGWLVGLAGAVKLTPFVFLGLFVIQRDWRTLARSALVAAAITGLMWLKWPAASRAYWLHDAFNARRVGGVGYAGNQSWYGVLHRWPFGNAGQSAVWLVFVALTVAATAFVAWRSVQRHYPVHAMVALALGGLLISPISWTHHWVWVALIPLLLIGPQRGNLATSVRLSLGILLVISIMGPYWWDPSAHAGVLLTDSLTLWAAVTLGVWLVAEHRLASKASPIVRR